MSSTRIKGKGLTLTINDVDYQCDATSVVLLNEESDEDSDALTFCDISDGGAVSWFFDISAITSTDSDSFWSYLWDNAGTAGVSYLFAPHANETPTADQPHFTGTVTLPAKPQIGGEANSTWTFETRLEVEQEPTKVVGA